MSNVLEDFAFAGDSFNGDLCFSPPLGGVVMLKVSGIGAFAKNHCRTVAFGTGTF
ncbi:MAG: hypothetical protein VXZ38_07895 [Planctomycetota bacterium]|nr:hypothetical protein [Planctomycetota bacterium]